MHVAAFTSCTPGFQRPKHKYDSSRLEFFNSQFADDEVLLTDLGCHTLDVQGLSAEEGIQLLQDCIVTAARHNYNKAEALPAQPHHKPWSH